MPYCNNIFYRTYTENNNRYSYPVILLHGSAGNHMSWPNEQRRLPGQRVIAVDLPGHGNSQGPACHNIDSLVRQLRNFLQGLHIHQVALVGHSLGSALALQYAAAYPECVRGMVLLACGISFSVPPHLLDTLLNPNRKQVFIEQFNQIAFDRNFPQAQRRLILAPLNTIRTSTIAADLIICSKLDLSNHLGGIDCPVSLISGSSDQICPAAAVRQLADAIPNASVKIVPNCGHMLLYEKTTQITQMISEFLNSVTFLQ